MDQAKQTPFRLEEDRILTMAWGHSSLHKRSHGVEPRDAAWEQERVGHPDWKLGCKWLMWHKKTAVVQMSWWNAWLCIQKRQNQKQARRFGNAHDQAQPVLPRWPLGEHWLDWMHWSRLLLARAAKQVKVVQAKMGFVGSHNWRVQMWFSIKHRWIQILQVPHQEVCFSLPSLPPPLSLFLSQLFSIVLAAFSTGAEVGKMALKAYGITTNLDHKWIPARVHPPILCSGGWGALPAVRILTPLINLIRITRSGAQTLLKRKGGKQARENGWPVPPPRAVVWGAEEPLSSSMGVGELQWRYPD